MRTLYLTICLIATIYLGVEEWKKYDPRLPAPAPDEVSEIIDRYESGLIQQESLRHMLNAMGQKEE